MVSKKYVKPNSKNCNLPNNLRSISLAVFRGKRGTTCRAVGSIFTGGSGGSVIFCAVVAVLAKKVSGTTNSKLSQRCRNSLALLSKKFKKCLGFAWHAVRRGEFLAPKRTGFESQVSRAKLSNPWNCNTLTKIARCVSPGRPFLFVLRLVESPEGEYLGLLCSNRGCEDCLKESSSLSSWFLLLKFLRRLSTVHFNEIDYRFLHWKWPVSSFRLFHSFDCCARHVVKSPASQGKIHVQFWYL